MKWSLLLSMGLGPALSSGLNTIWLAGDSTMAPGGGARGTEGWGQFLQYSFDPAVIHVNNRAFAGRSARTFTREGRFNAIVEQVAPGDWVVLQFGHNDGGDPANDPKNRADCPGMDAETCTVEVNGQTEIVQTYSTYLREVTNMILDKSGKVIIASPTPSNPFKSGTYSWSPTRYNYYAWSTVAAVGGPERGVYYVDHANQMAQAIKNLDLDAAEAGYPNDASHLSPTFADMAARAFVFGLKCGTAPLRDLIVNETIVDPVLGDCLQMNATLPIDGEVCG